AVRAGTNGPAERPPWRWRRSSPGATPRPGGRSTSCPPAPDRWRRPGHSRSKTVDGGGRRGKRSSCRPPEPPRGGPGRTGAIRDPATRPVVRTVGGTLRPGRGELRRGCRCPRGHVAGEERREGLRVVPVQEVPLVALQTFDRGQRPVESFDQGIHRQQAQIVRRERGEEAHAQ